MKPYTFENSDALMERAKKVVPGGIYGHQTPLVLTKGAYPSFFAGQRAQLLPILEISAGFVAIWLGIGLLASIVRRPRHAFVVLSAAAAAVLVIVTTALGEPSVPPLAPPPATMSGTNLTPDFARASATCTTA